MRGHCMDFDIYAISRHLTKQALYVIIFAVPPLIVSPVGLFPYLWRHPRYPLQGGTMLSFLSRLRWRTRVIPALSVAILLSLVAFPALVAYAASPLQISSDPFTQATCAASNTTNHHTEVEPDTFSNASTIVATFQVGRVFDGGSCDIGFATSTNNGGTWANGLLPGTTVFATPAGPYDRISDPAVAFDAMH